MTDSMEMSGEAWKERVSALDVECGDLEARIAELKRGRCEHCGATTISGCSTCGAPQCCPQCCRITELEGELDVARGEPRILRYLGKKEKQRAEQAEAENTKLREALRKFIAAWDKRRAIVGESRMDVAYICAKRALKPASAKGGAG